MLKFALAAAPYIMRAQSKRVSGSFMRRFIILMMYVFGVMALFLSAFFFLLELFGPKYAFLGIGLTLVLIASIFSIISQKRVVKKALKVKPKSSDPLTSAIPENIANDPRFEKILATISENPIQATAAATALGMLLSSEFLGEK